jgi:hypothetical protein
MPLKGLFQSSNLITTHKKKPRKFARLLCFTGALLNFQTLKKTITTISKIPL